MESRLYACLRCKKDVKSISGLTRHVNACKIPITLSSHQPPKQIRIFEDNMTNRPNLPSDGEDISPKASNYSEKRIKLAGNNNDNIRPVNIDQQRPIISN